MKKTKSTSQRNAGARSSRARGSALTEHEINIIQICADKTHVSGWMEDAIYNEVVHDCGHHVYGSVATQHLAALIEKLAHRCRLLPNDNGEPRSPKTSTHGAEK